MITTNINTTPPNYEEEINSFYLTQLDRTYDEGVVLTKSSSIGCRPLAFAIKAGTKILINGISLEIYSDAAQSAVEFFITATTLTESINKGSKITIDKENLFLQYQRKTEGQVAGFDIDADGISKGGIEITGWLNSDTLEGATVNNLPTALSVKNYVDNSHPAEDQTLQEVTDRGATTTNDIIGASITLGDGTSNEKIRVYYSDGTYMTMRGYGLEMDRSVNYIRPNITNSKHLRIGNTSLNWAEINAYAITHRWLNGTAEKMRITSTGNVGIGTTSPGYPLHIKNTSGANYLKIESPTNTNSGIVFSDGANRALLAVDPSDNMLFYVGGINEKMRITSAGNVGIGTPAPTEKLHVVGDALITGGLEVNAANIDFRGLGTSDPGVAGRLWQDSGILKISEG